MNLADQIDKNKLPQHIAIIMDGNGRWAQNRGLIRTHGHEQGAGAVKEVVKGCGELGVKHLTLFAFSTENWKRPKLEINTLMKLLISSLKQEIATLQEHGIRLNTIGNTAALPKRVQQKMEEVKKQTENNDQLVLTLALSYGSREEILKTVKELCKKVKNNLISPSDIDEKIINQHLYTHNLPDVDLLIRTSGEQRLSNFLLWQIAYAELHFTKVLWPDYKKENLFEAVIEYQQRERRFGKTSEQIKK
ncbi:MAG TPA: isoprenyl transferase [Flavobacteriaceae bacterium]|jgi:undecaprenyl diphosphate synthase|nr:isoprenyl transferase [Flavobacteriaceae bacterium]